MFLGPFLTLKQTLANTKKKVIKYRYKYFAKKYLWENTFPTKNCNWLLK